MIESLTGTVTAVNAASVHLNIGYATMVLQVPMSNQYAINTTATIYTYLHWNQEQGYSLFGFQEQFERSVFLIAIDCSGVGPKVALSILANLGARLFIRAIQNADAKLLSSVPGIGLKRAEQIIVQLKHKIDADLLGHVSEEQEHWLTVTQALEALHYSRGEILQAIDYVRSKTDSGKPNASFDQILRQALTYLAKQRQ
jgi:Holliday junction DNA helicase RuvA